MRLGHWLVVFPLAATAVCAAQQKQNEKPDYETARLMEGGNSCIIEQRNTNYPIRTVVVAIGDHLRSTYWRPSMDKGQIALITSDTTYLIKQGRIIERYTIKANGQLDHEAQQAKAEEIEIFTPVGELLKRCPPPRPSYAAHAGERQAMKTLSNE